MRNRKIDINEVAENIMNSLSNKEEKENYEFALKNIQENYVSTLTRSSEFCVDLSEVNIENWTKEQCRAFCRLFVKFSDAAQENLTQRMGAKLDVSKDPQFLYLKLPLRNDSNYRKVNYIQKKLLNNRYKDDTGNETSITLLKIIDPAKQNLLPMRHKIRYSISLVIVTEKNEALLLLRGGRSGRRGVWGTLTGNIEGNETPAQALQREAFEETKISLKDKVIHCVGLFHTRNLGKDLVKNKKAISHADDLSYLYVVRVPEEEVRKLELDGENTNWGLYNVKGINELFPPDAKNQLHVAAAKVLTALYHAEENFTKISMKSFNYPYTNSPGFFVTVAKKHRQEDQTFIETPRNN